MISDAASTRAGTRLTRQPWPRRLGRLGLAARAVVYAVLAWITVDIAFTRQAPAEESGQGALAEVARQPAGPLALGVLAGGILAYALWRLSGALGAGGTAPPGGWTRLGWAGMALVYLALFAQAVEILIGRSPSSGASSDPRPFVAHALGWPAGPAWVGLAGATAATAGTALAVWGLLHDHRAELRGAPRPTVAGAARLTGAAGNLTRGALVGLVAAYLLAAAATGDPAEVKSLDALLLEGAHRSWGPVVLSLVALGLCAFAAFSAIEARYRRL